MSLIDGSIKEIFSVNLKYRHDDYTDQFSRIFMVKMLIISSLVTSMEFFTDRVACILPKSSDLEPDFVHSACWIQGFYIYTELFHRLKESGAYGMPKDVEVDGIRDDRHLCRRISKIMHERDPTCHPLTKMYFTQYQYMPFYIASLAVLYYAPYILFRFTSNDMIDLDSQTNDTAADDDSIKIADLYFNYDHNGGVFGLRLRVFATAGVKLIYVIVNMSGFIFTNRMLNHRYAQYGLEWIRWSSLNNTIAYDYSGLRNYPRPGNYLLPSMGFCDISEGSTDVRSVLTNQYRIICEISPHILYQYVLLVLWFLFVMSTLISILGFLHYTISVMSMSFNVVVSSDKKGKVELFSGCGHMTVREMQYMKLIRSRNTVLYKELINLLHQGQMV